MIKNQQKDLPNTGNITTQSTNAKATVLVTHLGFVYTSKEIIFETSISQTIIDVFISSLLSSFWFFENSLNESTLARFKNANNIMLNQHLTIKIINAIYFD